MTLPPKIYFKRGVRLYSLLSALLLSVLSTPPLRAQQGAQVRLPVEASACIQASQRGVPQTASCRALTINLVDQAHRYYLNGNAAGAQAYLVEARRMAPRSSLVAYEQAIVHDALGRPELARPLYDAVRGTAMEAQAAVPSAINYAALGRFTEAFAAFTALSRSNDPYTASYAQLWQLWLQGRAGQGDAAHKRAQRIQMANGMRGATAAHRALIDLYAGRGKVDNALAVVHADSSLTAQQRRDALAEVAFFGGGYLQYDAGDAKAARALYQRQLPNAYASSERPLIQQSLAALNARAQ